MTEQEKAMRLALEALGCKDGWGSSVRDAKEKAINALRAALDQSAQDEPVECMCGICKLGKREPLTDEQIHEVRNGFGYQAVGLVAFARAIEAAHQIGVKK